jgi:hypothetical protein
LLECIGRLTGVEYLSAEAGAKAIEAAAPGPDERPFPEAVRRLPLDLVRALRLAVRAADYSEMLSLVDEIAKLDGLLGSQLRERVNQFDYATLELILGVKGTNE